MTISGMRRLAAALAVASFFSITATAQEYPQKPIRFIVGPSPDVLARLIGEKLTTAWKQPVIIDQRTAASGLVAADAVAKAAPDGYTLFLSTAADTINETLFARQKQYDLMRDLAPVTYLASVPFFLVVPSSVQAGSLAELIQMAKAKPGEVNYASPGSGSPPHMASEMLNTVAGVKITGIPYKTVPDALNDLLAGRVQVLFAVATVGMPQVKAGKLRALAVSSAKRYSGMPDLPTVAETYPGFEVVGWYGVQTTARTPSAIINRLNVEIVRALNAPDVMERVKGLGLEPMGSTPEQFAAIIRQEVPKWARVIRESNIRSE